MPILQDIAVAIICLNESNQIIECVESVRKAGFSDISIYDGGSVDSTIDKVRGVRPQLKVFIENSSLSSRRNLAIHQCRKPFLLFLDADQRLLEDSNWSHLEELSKDKKLAGIQFEKRAVNQSNYWEKGFEVKALVIQRESKIKKVIGTPCIYRVELLRQNNYSTNVEGAGDDTFVGHSIGSLGYYFKTVNISSVEYFRESGYKTFKKAYWYGSGDFEFVRKNRKYASNHIFHVMVRNTIIYPITTFSISPKHVPFMFFFGIGRVFGFLLAPFGIFKIGKS